MIVAPPLPSHRWIYSIVWTFESVCYHQCFVAKSLGILTLYEVKKYLWFKFAVCQLNLVQSCATLLLQVVACKLRVLLCHYSRGWKIFLGWIVVIAECVSSHLKKLYACMLWVVFVSLTQQQYTWSGKQGWLRYKNLVSYIMFDCILYYGCFYSVSGLAASFFPLKADEFGGVGILFAQK